MDKKLYGMLSFTGGLLCTIVGFLVGLFFKLFKKKTRIYKGAFATDKPEGNFCFSIGPFTFVCDEGTYINNHEFGHCIQNAVYGPLVLFLVYIPSMITSHSKKHSDMGYEKQATKGGSKDG